LLVEDQPINRELLARQFLALGVKDFDVAENGLEAWEAFGKHAYDLVITDCAMPLMDGETLIRHIRASEIDSGRHAHLIALTANAMAPQRQACLDAGADDVMIKPVDLDQLRHVLDDVFGAQPPPACLPQTELPAGIPAEEWPQLRKRIVEDMARELEMVSTELARGNAKRAWEAAHRVVGIARWFRLADLTSSALALQTALDEKRAPDAEIDALKASIVTFIETA